MSEASDSADLAARVEAARAGDADAFAVLVARFEDMAVGCAYAWLKDADQALDAAQDAFLDAFLHLGQLRDSNAFPGWFRRVVLKHCDRHARRRRPEHTPLDQLAELPDGSAPEGEALAGERSARLREAIETLPDDQRIAVALHYLAGEAQDRVADFLELPLSTVKKRLHSARKRLRQHLAEGEIEAMTQPLDELRPSTTPTFSRTIQLFLAVRAGDRNGVKSLLDLDPTLVEAEESWETELAIERDLPIPTRATPLIRAAERGDLALVDLLIERGANVDGDCGCAGGETPLWAALATARSDVVRRLLEHGADPNHSAFAGNSPLHVAAIRGLEDCTRELLAHGADPGARADSGETPLDWAHRNGEESIAEMLEAASEQLDAHATRPSPRVARREGPHREAQLRLTGVKAIDLFAPLTEGSIVRWLGGAHVGRDLLLAELAASERRRGGNTVWAVWERHDWESGEVDQLLAETGTREHVHVVRSNRDEAESERRSAAARAVSVAENLLAQGPVTLVLFEPTGHRADIEAAMSRLGGRGGLGNGVERSLTAFLVAPLSAHRDAPPELKPPIDARICLDPTLGERQLFPAIHPLLSESRALRPEVVGERHCRLASEARELLSRAREQDPSASGNETSRRAEVLQAYLTQPFHVTEAFSGRPGASVSRTALLDDVERILAGELDDAPRAALLYRGALEERPGATGKVS